MIYCFFFHFSIIVLLLSYNLVSSLRQKRVFSILIIVILVYFSGFRDGLGTDYQNYLIGIETKSYLDSYLFGFTEPLFNLLCIIVKVSIFSPILVFLICALVANVGICMFLFENKKFAMWAVLLYVFIPTLYSQSFNLMRQFFAIGIFYFSFKYVGVSFKKYLSCCVFASLMHMSAILLIPLYWMAHVDIKRRYVILIFLAVSFIAVLGIGYFFPLEGYKYSHYADDGQNISSSSMILLYNVIFLLFFFNKQSFYNFPVFYRNLYILFVIFIDMSNINIIFYRFSYYFIPVIALAIPYTLHRSFKSQVPNLGLILFLILLFYSTRLSNPYDRTIVPEKMLPLISIVDSHYR